VAFPWQQSPRDRNINILNKKKIEFLVLTNFILFNRGKKNSSNNQDYIKLVISFRGGHFDYALGHQKS
jgi:hypothetical protein